MTALHCPARCKNFSPPTNAAAVPKVSTPSAFSRTTPSRRAHEAAIEQYLRDELEYVVVETYDHARAGVSMLRDEVAAAHLLRGFAPQLRLSSEYEPIVNFPREDGVISVSTSCGIPRSTGRRGQAIPAAAALRVFDG